MQTSRAFSKRQKVWLLGCALVVAGCNGAGPSARTTAQLETCDVDDDNGSVSVSQDDVSALYDTVAAAIADGTAVAPPDDQVFPLMDGDPDNATDCEGCGPVVITMGDPDTAEPPAVAQARMPAPPRAATPEGATDCNCPGNTYAFGNWGQPNKNGLDACGKLTGKAKPFLFKPYTNACKNDKDCKKLLAQAMENCQKILEILKDQKAGKNGGICQQTPKGDIRNPSFGNCEIQSLTDLGCTNAGSSGDVWTCPAPNTLPPAPCPSMTDFCGKNGGFVQCASDMWNTLNTQNDPKKPGYKPKCDYAPKPGNKC